MPPVPRISILMPVRNESMYLPEALDSLAKQTFTDWELVVVDDGSTDASPSILSKAACRDKRIHIISLHSVGLVAALNAGLAVCKAPLVARMDGDDICHPKRLEFQVSYMDKNSDTGLAACNFLHFPRTDLKQGMRTYEKWQNSLNSHELIIRDRFVESPFVHPSVVVRRSIINSVGGYQDMGWPEDYDLWLRLANAGVRFAKLPEILFFWRDHPKRSTRVMNEYTINAFRACKLHHLMLSYLDSTQEVVIAGAGLEGRAWHRLLAIEGIKISAWIDVDKRKIGRTLHGAPVYNIKYLSSCSSKILVAIGVHGAREQFRELVLPLGLKEGTDFICIA